MANYFKILGLDPTGKNVTEGDIKKAYRKLAKEWHPDKVVDEEKKAEANIRFKAINEAYHYLLDHPGYVPGDEINQAAYYAYNSIIQSIKQWPEEDQNTANQYLQNPEVVKNFLKWIEIEQLTSLYFREPVRPLFWEILSDSGYIAYCPSKGYEVIHPIFRATMNQAYNVDSDTCPYMFKFKWKIVKENLDNCQKNKTEETFQTFIKVRFAIYSGHIFSCDYYLRNVYNNFVSPLESKIKKLRAKQDIISLEKADQLQTALNEIENKFGQSMESFVNNHKHQALDRLELTAQTHELHRIFIGTVKTLSQAEKINKRSNLIGDILRGALGVFLATITLGVPLYSQRFINTFFYVDTKIKLNDAKNNIHDVMYEWHKINKWEPSMRG